MSLLPIPVPDNSTTGWSCGEVAVLAALEYLGVKPLPTLQTLHELTHKTPAYNTWPEQLLRIAQVYPNTRARLYRQHPVLPSIEAYLQTFYPECQAHLLKETDGADFQTAIAESIGQGTTITAPVNLASILAEVKEGQVVIPWVCFDTLYNRTPSKGFNAHYVIVTGFNDTHVFVHECGNRTKLPEANKPIPHQRFAEALGSSPNFMVWKL